MFQSLYRDDSKMFDGVTLRIERAAEIGSLSEKCNPVPLHPTDKSPLVAKSSRIYDLTLRKHFG